MGHFGREGRLAGVLVVAALKATATFFPYLQPQLNPSGDEEEEQGSEEEAAVQVATIEDITQQSGRRAPPEASEQPRDQSLMKKLTQLLPLNIPVARKVAVSG